MQIIWASVVPEVSRLLPQKGATGHMKNAAVHDLLIGKEGGNNWNVAQSQRPTLVLTSEKHSINIFLFVYVLFLFQPIGLFWLLLLFLISWKDIVSVT